jgi:NAD+ kinase
MATIGLVVRPGVEAAQDLARELAQWAGMAGHKIVADSRTAEAVGLAESIEYHRLTQVADPIVTLGGDGTLIGIARHVAEESPVMVGVNFGTLGFLTEISPSELFSVLEEVLAGNADVAERTMLLTRVIRGKEQVFQSSAVNDAVVQKGSRDKLLDLDFLVGSESVMRIRADGLIFATPTGSTAYSLAAGGSIAFPTLQVVLVTPICAHSITSRPLILPLDSALEIRIPEYDGEVFLSVDGQDSCPLQTGDLVSITRDPHLVRFVKSPSRSYFDILRTKLNWGVANKGD